ncbi:MAG: hypothetical protein LBM27_03815, partial [Lactobacillaceae bacterium]|nr:hypothetical protein [Lactobacillaceae bacterium]
MKKTTVLFSLMAMAIVLLVGMVINQSMSLKTKNEYVSSRSQNIVKDNEGNSETKKQDKKSSDSIVTDESELSASQKIIYDEYNKQLLKMTKQQG